MRASYWPWLAAALGGIGSAAAAQTTAFTASGCRVQLQGQWQISGDSATGPREISVQLLSVPSTQMVINMARNSDFALVEQTPALFLFRRVTADGVLHFRSVTRTAPPAGACVADVVVPPADAGPGMAVAKSIASAN